MQITHLIILIVIGLLSGFIGGSLGVGGGIVIVPCLVFILGFSQHQAQGTSIVFMLPPIGILAAYNYHKLGVIDYKIAIILSLTFIIGAYYKLCKQTEKIKYDKYKITNKKRNK